MKNYSFLLFLFLFGFSLVCSAQEVPRDATAVDSLDARDPIAAEEDVDSFKLNASVTMYPNPVQHYLSIRSDFPITRVQVFSLLGQLVMEVPSNFSRIYLGELNSGIYMIKIYSNEYYITKKLVKR